MNAQPSLSAVVAFARVAEHASFTRAANALGVSPSALSQTVRALEASMGVRLLHRTTRRVGLTEHGARFLARVRGGLAQIDAAFEDLDSVRAVPAGKLRINVPRVAAELLVLPYLPGFLARYPQVEVELFVEPALVDLVAGGFDAGIRLGECLARDMIAVPIGPAERQVVVATPDYLARHGAPRTPADLVDHDCIVHRLSTGRLMAWEFSADGRDFEVAVAGRLVFNDAALVHAAARAGMGLAQGFEAVMAEDIAAGRLCSVLQAWQAPFAGFHLYYPAREQMAPKLRVFIDHLRQAQRGG
ncbi:LysR family transcriptional regulator [Stenotrophomonas sp.]|uniref:LysR family transcriptional regulator n=1 Tax=Stenotrophomonas sp. TaxID=69392 RepID=UPI002FCA52BC